MRSIPVSGLSLAIIALILVSLGTAVGAETVNVRFWSQGQLVLVQRGVPAGMPPAEAAVRALVAGPTQTETALGVSSMIAAGVAINDLVIAGDSARIDMSPEVITSFDEAVLLQIFEQFRATLGDFPSILSIKLTCNNVPLSAFLAPAPEVGEPAPSQPIATSGVGLTGKKICVGPSHGRFWNGSGWYWQRSDPCGFGESVLEDTNSIRLVQFLKQYLTQDGATFTSPRQLDESDCCNSDTGLAWWKMCAQSWLHHAGYSCSIWASYSGNCGADTATSRSSDDIRARPLFADNRGADIYIAHHTNAGGGGTATGTETFRDTSMEHPAHEAASYNLALAVQNSVISTIRSTFPEEPNWANRGVKDSAGGFGEIRIPNRPAILIELAFHDDCSRDASYLRDDFFRSISEWAVYAGVCSYFGNTPTWDKYSDEYVSDTIPTTMNPGQSYSVSVTMRNRGICWLTSRGFRLGAVGDSDPFTAFNRVDISGTIKPGATYTFNFTMTAPATPGTYTSDWQMVRDGYAWFGATCTKTITVGSVVDTQAPSVPQNVRRTAATGSSITVAWDASTDNVGVVGYRVYRNGAQIGTSAGTTFSDTGLASNTAYSYEVDAYDATPNYSVRSAAGLLATGATWSRTTSSADTYIRSGSTGVVSSQHTLIQCGWSSTASVAIRRGLVQWDMTGAPTQAEVLNAAGSVRARLQCVNRSVDTATNIYLNRVTTEWTEANANWDLVGNAWEATTLATTSVGPVGDYLWSWNGHSLGIPIQNRGLIVRNANETTSNAKNFQDKDGYGGYGGAPPRLEIDYVDLTAPSGCSVSINGGAAYASDANVTLDLSATDYLSGMSLMQFSEDGVDYSSPEPYAATRSYAVSAGDGPKTVYVKFRDAVGNWSAPVSDSIILDALGPMISSVNVSPPMVPGGYPVTVTVIATDENGISGVTAAGIPLAPSVGDSWVGQVTALSAIGNHEVPVVATDLAAKHSLDSSCAYKTGQVFGIANASLLPLAPTQWSAPNHLYKVWGVVKTYGSDHFTVDDGSMSVVYVYCPGYSLVDGQKVSVIGIYNCSESPPELQTVPTQIQIF